MVLLTGRGLQGDRIAGLRMGAGDLGRGPSLKGAISALGSKPAARGRSERSRRHVEKGFQPWSS